MLLFAMFVVFLRKKPHIPDLLSLNKYIFKAKSEVQWLVLEERASGNW